MKQPANAFSVCSSIILISIENLGCTNRFLQVVFFHERPRKMEYGCVFKNGKND